MRDFRTIFAIVLLVGVFVSGSTAKGKSAKGSYSDIRVDPIQGGKPYGAGAVFNLTKKGVDFLASQLNELLTSALRSMPVPDVGVFAFDNGDRLAIDSIRVSEYYAQPFQYDTKPRSRFVYWTEKNRLVAWGQWHMNKSDVAPVKSGKVANVAKSHAPTTETGRVAMTAGEASINVTTIFQRTNDGKSSLHFVDCVANFERWTVDFFAPSHAEFVNATSYKLRKHFEDTTCKLMRDYFVEVIGVALSSFPNRIPLTSDKKFVLDYDLLNDEPVLANKSMKGELKGQVLWQNYYTAPFWPAYETTTCVTEACQPSNDRMVWFRLGDYAFNTLLHHAYWHDLLRMSALDSIPESSPLRSRLRLRCSSAGHGEPSCFGDVFGNATDNYPANSTGDLVFKPDRRPPTVLVRSTSNGTSVFDAYGGWLEAYATTVVRGTTVGTGLTVSTKRDLLARMKVVAINGDFIPSLTGKMNITGSVRLTQLQLASDVTRVSPRMKEWRDQLAQLATPIIEHMFNAFLEQAQFPLFIPSNVECVPPANFLLTERTMHVQCDLRPLIGQPMFLTLEKARKLRGLKW